MNDLDSESLLIASLKYQVAGLANLSEEFLSRNIAVDNVIRLVYNIANVEYSPQ